MGTSVSYFYTEPSNSLMRRESTLQIGFTVRDNKGLSICMLMELLLDAVCDGFVNIVLNEIGLFHFNAIRSAGLCLCLLSRDTREGRQIGFSVPLIFQLVRDMSEIAEWPRIVCVFTAISNFVRKQ